MNLKMLGLTLLVSLGVVLGQSECPSSLKESNDNLVSGSTEDGTEYSAFDHIAEEQGYSSLAKSLKIASECPDPSDSVEEVRNPPLTRRKRGARPAVSTYCEPCPSRQNFLANFYKVCWVLFWNIQQVRYVTCPGNPYSRLCTCEAYRCQPIHYVRVWFLSYCEEEFILPSGYRVGLNYNYLWLPQECSCRRC